MLKLVFFCRPILHHQLFFLLLETMGSKKMSFWSRISLLYRSKKELKKRSQVSAALNRSSVSGDSRPQTTTSQMLKSYNIALNQYGLVTLDFDKYRPLCRSSLLGTTVQAKTWAAERVSSSSGFESLSTVSEERHFSSRRCHWDSQKSTNEDCFHPVYGSTLSREDYGDTTSVSWTRVSATKSSSSLENNVGSTTSLDEENDYVDDCFTVSTDSNEDTDSDDEPSSVGLHRRYRSERQPARTGRRYSGRRRTVPPNHFRPMTARGRLPSRTQQQQEKERSNSADAVVGRHPDTRPSLLSEQQASDGTWIWFPGSAAVSRCPYGCVTTVTLGQHPVPQVVASATPLKPIISGTGLLPTHAWRRRSLCNTASRSYRAERPLTVGPEFHYFV